MAAQNLRVVGDRIEQLLDELHATADPATCALAQELLRLVTELYGGGLERVVVLAREDAPELVDRLLADELVASLLLVHGLHPESVTARVEQALESVRPFLATHDGDVELLDIDEDAGAVHLRLLGSCDGCPSSAVTLQRRGRAGDRRGGARDHDHRRRTAVDRGPRTVGDRHAGDPDPQAGAALRELSHRGCGAMSGDPLAAVRRLRRAPSPPPPVGETCELCREPMGPEHNHLVDLERRNLMCACRVCWLLFAPDGAGGGHFKAVPERYVAFPDLRLTRRRVGLAPDPGERRVLLRELDASIASPRSTRARRARPSRSSRSTRGTSSRSVTPSWRRCCPTSRRSSCAPYAVPTRRSASSCPSTRATSWSVGCGCCGGASTAGRRRTRRSKRSSSRCGRGRRERPRVRGARRAARAVRGGADDHAPPAGHRAQRDAGARRGAALPGAHRAPAAALHRRRDRGPGRGVRRAHRSGADSLRPFLWTHVSTTVSSFSGSTEVDLPITCTYDFEVSGTQVLPRARPTARSRSSCCSRARRSSPVPTGSRSPRWRGTRRPRSVSRWRCGRG